MLSNLDVTFTSLLNKKSSNQKNKVTTMGSSEATLNQTKKIAETGTSHWSYIVMKGAKIFPGHY